MTARLNPYLEAISIKDMTKRARGQSYPFAV
jgi:hypothetical protein